MPLNKQKYNKPPLTIAEQIKLLKVKGDCLGIGLKVFPLTLENIKENIKKEPPKETPF